MQHTVSQALYDKKLVLTCIEQATKYLTDKLYLLKSFIYMYLWLKALKSDIESL